MRKMTPMKTFQLKHHCFTWRAIVVLAGFLLLMTLNGIAQTGANSGCVISFDTTRCFTVNDSVPIQVGLQVTKLDESFRFCLTDQIFSGVSPIQVVIAIDRSGSMDDNDPKNMRCQAAHDFVDDLNSKSPGSYVGSVVFSSGVAEKYSKRPIILSDTVQFDSLWNSIEMASRGGNPNYRPDPVVEPIVTASPVGPVLKKTLATYQGQAFVAVLGMLLRLRTSVPGMKQHIIMITDDGWFEEDADIMPRPLLAEYGPLFPNDSFPTIHTVMLTGDGNPADRGVKGLANIQLLLDYHGYQTVSK